MQVDERRACPSCSADNPQNAEFCWQCYARFVPVPPAPGAGQPHRLGSNRDARPEHAGGSARGAVLAPGGRVAKIVVGVVVALVVGGFVRNLLAPDYHVPEVHRRTAADPRRDHRQFERDMIAEGDTEGLEIEAAAYGAGGQPDVLFILVRGKAAENTDELFSSFLDGIASSGVTVDRQRGEHRRPCGCRVAMPPTRGGQAPGGRVHVARGRDRGDDAGPLAGRRSVRGAGRGLRRDARLAGELRPDRHDPTVERILRQRRARRAGAPEHPDILQERRTTARPLEREQQRGGLQRDLAGSRRPRQVRSRSSTDSIVLRTTRFS